MPKTVWSTSPAEVTNTSMFLSFFQLITRTAASLVIKQYGVSLLGLSLVALKNGFHSIEKKKKDTK